MTVYYVNFYVISGAWCLDCYNVVCDVRDTPLLQLQHNFNYLEYVFDVIIVLLVNRMI